MRRIGIVGAGAAAAAAAYAIETTRREPETHAGTDSNSNANASESGSDEPRVTVLEKSGGLCGRAATRRRGDVTYDYGANYVKADDDRVVELLTETLETDGLIDVTDPVWTFDSEGTISAGRDADDHKWSYEAGLTQIAKRLFDRTDATVHRNARVETIRREPAAGTWRLEDDAGDQWGPFDALLLNPPAPQTAALLRAAEWDAAVRTRLADAAAAVPYRTIWTGILHYPFELEAPYYALVNTDKDHEIGWIAREECKPGHVPDGESLLVVQANHEWSVDRLEDDADPDDALEDLAELTADLLGDERLLEPDWTDHQGWRYALPEDGVATDPLEAAEDAGLYCLGDWVAGEGRLHAALRNGLETGERIAKEVSD